MAACSIRLDRHSFTAALARRRPTSRQRAALSDRVRSSDGRFSRRRPAPAGRLHPSATETVSWQSALAAHRERLRPLRPSLLSWISPESRHQAHAQRERLGRIAGSYALLLGVASVAAPRLPRAQALADLTETLK